MNFTMLISVIVYVAFATIVSQISCKFIPPNSELNNGSINHLQSDLILLTKQNVSVANERIVGGDPVPITAYPWIVSLIFFYKHYCAGSIVSTTKIVSAAHCVKSLTHILDPKNRLKIRAGSSKHTGGQVVDISNVVIHPSYNSYTFDNDISVLTLVSSLKMSAEVSVIALPKQNEPIADGTIVVVAGWGSMKEYGHLSDTLRAVSVPTVGNDQCGRMYSYFHPITKSMLCAGFKEGKKDSCQGDSGGPLSFDRTLVGVVSWGKGCARPNYPGVYTRVASFTGWIKSHL